MKLWFRLVLAGALGLALVSSANAADRVVAAVNKLSAGAPLFIAIDKGYFAEQGLDVSLMHLTSSQAIGLSVVSGNAQFGMTAITAGIYTMAGKGGLKMIAGGYEEHPGFHGVAIVANKTAYEHGLRKPADLAGKKIAITAVGSGSHNQLARLAKKYRLNFADMHLVPVQTLANEVSAVKGGQVDATPVPATLAEKLEVTGGGKIIAWMGDEIPTQFGGIFASPETIAKHRALTQRFLRAYVKAIEAYDRAFQQRGADGHLLKGKDYDGLLDVISRHTGQPRKSIEIALPYFNPEATLKIADLAEQIDVYKSLKLVDSNLKVDAIVDRSFVPIAEAHRQ